MARCLLIVQLCQAMKLACGLLLEAAPETLKTATINGRLPSHLAADSGHEACLRLLLEAAPETLKAATNNGALPSHCAALSRMMAGCLLIVQLTLAMKLACDCCWKLRLRP
eukprot:TRINITY_DN13104_c0_g1_i1.p1 TRINITY_DN13104_c0_g1~~TRINITY_DN13104_c0_g1_i1.p1  ORF type:complete len:111 (+),score=30.12 TRINITY_DN13104_c0_g1_i1:56-388(+)